MSRYPSRIWVFFVYVKQPGRAKANSIYEYGKIKYDGSYNYTKVSYPYLSTLGKRMPSCNFSIRHTTRLKLGIRIDGMTQKQIDTLNKRIKQACATDTTTHTARLSQ